MISSLELQPRSLSWRKPSIVSQLVLISLLTPTPQIMLCAVCATMFQNVSAAGRKPFHETFTDLVISVTQGCWVCTIIASKLQNDFGLIVEKASNTVDEVQLTWQSERRQQKLSLVPFLSIFYIATRNTTGRKPN